MEPPAFAAGPPNTVRAAPGACAALGLQPPTGTPPFLYQWSRADATLDDRFTTSEDAGGVRLTVRAARAGDSGVYTLQASNAAGSDTARVRLEVSDETTGEDPPTFLRRLQDLTVKVGTRTRFLVEIISSTECKVTWYRNERRLMEAERVTLARDGNFWCADVAAVSVDDAGRWTCTAENAGGRASCSAHLNVLVPKAYKRPEFVEELRALLTEQGTVSLECKVVGVPTPVLRWFKDSKEIKAGDVFALTANAEDPTSLGTYTCEAINCMGRAYSSSKVHVVGRTSREGSAKPSTSGVTPEPPPIFTKELEDKHVKICEPLTLGCQLVVPPWPRAVVWYNKEGKLEAGDRYHVTEDGVGGYLLEVSSAEWSDEGEWKAVATSAGGRVGISSCYVTMDVPKNYRKPRFMENLQAVLTEEGLVSFECKVVGFPTPVLSWFKDGQELKPGDVYQLTGTNSLGSYCCIARNCMGQASSSAELTVEDIQNQLNEEEKLQLFSKNQAPKFVQGLKSVEAKIDEPFRFTIKVAIPPDPSVLWYRDDQPVDESTRCHLSKEERGVFHLDIQNLEFLDQAEWKCVAMNDFGHSVTSCFLKLIIPRHYKKPRFLENLQAILSDEGAVNLECKVIGVPQPVLKWYKDGEELKPGDIHRIISGQDGTCCLGTYTCEAQNCMGIAASSASLLGFDDSMKAKTKKAEEQALQRNLSLSTIHEERTSQMYDTPIGDITFDDKGEISFSFDGKEVSVSLYETPDLTEEEALQIVEMYADQLSENVTEHNVVELPPLRFVKETSTSGNLLMEAIIIDVSPEYFASPEEDLRTEADVEDISIAEENGPPQLSLDLDVDIAGEDYLEKTMALLSEEKSDLPRNLRRKKSDSQKSGEDFFSLSREQSLSEEKRDDETHISESELQSFASARSSSKVKSKSSKPSGHEGQESSDPTKTILFREEVLKSEKEDIKLEKNTTELENDIPKLEKQVNKAEKEVPEKEKTPETPVTKKKRERRPSRGSRRSSSGSEKSLSKSKEELLRIKADVEVVEKPLMTDEEFRSKMINISSSLTKVINDVQHIERDIILKSELMSSAAAASRSLEIISSLISPLSEIHSIADAAKEAVAESREVTSTIFNSIPQCLKALHQSLTILEKCIDVESDNKTLVRKTSVAFIETCGAELQKIVNEITSITGKKYLLSEQRVFSEIETLSDEIKTVIKFSSDIIVAKNLLAEANEVKHEEPSVETKHLRDTQKALFELKSPVNSLLSIVENVESGRTIDLVKVKSSEVILNDMAASIQDLQTALELVETLSVKESSLNLHPKYNTEIIETVMESILKLRGSFEQLSTETKMEEDKTVLKEALSSLKLNLTEIFTQIDLMENNVGCFDILQNENKLDMLQKMAQTLIALENNLPRLEPIPRVKTYMVTFHKNLTKVLEKVIDSNDAKKYFILMEICGAVNRINTSIKNVDVENVLPLASLSNTLNIIQRQFVKNVFDSELNCSVMSNIADTLVGIQEAINTAEELSLKIESERAQDLSVQKIDYSAANVIMEHIEQTIAAVNIAKSVETTQQIKVEFSPILENICPILEDLKRCIASTQPVGIEKDEYLSKICDAPVVQSIATPICELNQNIITLNQLIVENIDILKENNEVISAIAEPLHELHTTLEILQDDVISQYDEDVTPYDVSVNMASVVQNLQSCIVMIQEQAGVEAAEELSTLEDISGIKTSADTLPSDRLVLPTAEETAVEQSLPSFAQELPPTATAQALHTINEHITVLQNPEIIDALDTLSEVSDYSSLKSVVFSLGELHNGIENILHPQPVESSTDIAKISNVSKLVALAEPMHELHQSLSVLDTSNIPVYENILDLPTEKVHSVFETLSEFKDDLDKCIHTVFPAMDITNNTIEVSSRISTLRECCQQLKKVINTSKHVSNTILFYQVADELEFTIDNFLEAIDVSNGIKINEIKYLIEDLYQKVSETQEDMIQFTTQTPEKLALEAKLIEVVGEVETNIAVLEQYDFLDLSRASELTSQWSPQLGLEIESDSLLQVEDIVENAVNVMHDSTNETPFADLMIVEDFFKICKNEFTLLRCLIAKSTSHKKMIRLIQELISLQTILNDFKAKRSELKLAEDIDFCLNSFFSHADESLANVKKSFIKIVESQSDVLIDTPVQKLDRPEVIDKILENKKGTPIAEVIECLANVAVTLKSQLPSIQTKIIEEVDQPTNIRSTSEEQNLIDKVENLSSLIELKSTSHELDNISKRVLKKMMSCIEKHHDYKEAAGSGKTLIILKCLAECMDILQANILDKKVTVNEVIFKEKENTLKEVLTEMIEPLKALQTQLGVIREQVICGIDDDTLSIDITTTESLVQTMTELYMDVRKIQTENLKIDSEDISIIMEVDKEIHSIQDSIKSIENTSTAQVVKEITKPIEELERSLHDVLSQETKAESKNQLDKDQTLKLLQHIDQYIELIEIVEEISAVIKIEDVKNTLETAKELKENIVATENLVENMTTQETITELCEARSQLAHKLQKALSALQVQVLENAQELASSLSSDALQRFVQVTAQLQANLVAVTGVQVAIQAPLSKMSLSNKDLFILPVTEGVAAVFQTTVADESEPLILEQVHVFGDTDSTAQESIGVKMGKDNADLSAIDVEKVESEIEISSALTEEREYVQQVQIDRVVPVEKSEEIRPMDEMEVTTTTDLLMKHIKEYVSDDVIEVVNEISSIVNLSDLKESVNVAKELFVSVAALNSGVPEESTSSLREEIYEQEQKLTHQLHSALTVLHEQGLEHIQEQIPFIDLEALHKMVDVAENLESDLNVAIISQPSIIDIDTQKDNFAEPVKDSPTEKLPITATQKATEVTKIANETKQQITEESLPLEVQETAAITAIEQPSSSTEEIKVNVALESTVTSSVLDLELNISVAETSYPQVIEHTASSENVNVNQESTFNIVQETIELPKEMTHDINLLKTIETKEQVLTTTQALEKVLAESQLQEIIENVETFVNEETQTKELNLQKVPSSTQMASMDKVELLTQPNIAENKTISQALEDVKDLDVGNSTTEQAAEVTTVPLDKALIEHSGLIQHIDDFISDDVTQLINDLSTSTSLKETVTVAKELRESIIAVDNSITVEETSPLAEGIKPVNVQLVHKLQDALSTLQIEVLDSAHSLAPIVPHGAIERVTDIVLHLQEDLAVASVSDLPQKITVFESEKLEDTIKQIDIKLLGVLLQDINDKITITPENRDADETEALKDTLDEVQTVIIKLKQDYDGATNDTLNETLEDLECSVRSVQLQINEDSPPDLLKEACATLQLLVNNMNAIEDVQATETITIPSKTETILESCAKETDETVKLLELASEIDTKISSGMANIVSNLQILSNSLKTLRNKFLSDADTLVEHGIDVVQTLDQIEEKIFSLEKDLESEVSLSAPVRENILMAVHSVYSSISNMRGTISSIQKRFMFENYGKPSESLLLSIKNIALISNKDEESNITQWKKLSKTLRKVLNHFEDVKFYINLDKTARLPSDAAFTKIILDDLKTVVKTVLFPQAETKSSDIKQKVKNVLAYVKKYLLKIESQTSLEVKNKIPMFKEISFGLFDVTNAIYEDMIKGRIDIDDGETPNEEMVLPVAIELLKPTTDTGDIQQADISKIEQPENTEIVEIIPESKHESATEVLKVAESSNISVENLELASTSNDIKPEVMHNILADDSSDSVRKAEEGEVVKQELMSVTELQHESKIIECIVEDIAIKNKGEEEEIQTMEKTDNQEFGAVPSCSTTTNEEDNRVSKRIKKTAGEGKEGLEELEISEKKAKLTDDDVKTAEHAKEEKVATTATNDNIETMDTSKIEHGESVKGQKEKAAEAVNIEQEEAGHAKKELKETEKLTVTAIKEKATMGNEEIEMAMKQQTEAEKATTQKEIAEIELNEAEKAEKKALDQATTDKETDEVIAAREANEQEEAKMMKKKKKAAGEEKELSEKGKQEQSEAEIVEIEAADEEPAKMEQDHEAENVNVNKENEETETVKKEHGVAADKAKKEQEFAEKTKVEKEEAEMVKEEKKAATKVKKEMEVAEKIENEQEQAKNVEIEVADKTKIKKEAIEKEKKDQEGEKLKTEKEPVAKSKLEQETENAESGLTEKVIKDEVDTQRTNKDQEVAERVAKETTDQASMQQAAEKVKIEQEDSEKVKKEAEAAATVKDENEAAEIARIEQDEVLKAKKEVVEKSKKEEEATEMITKENIVTQKLRKENVAKAELELEEAEKAKTDATEKAIQEKEDMERANKEQEEAEKLAKKAAEKAITEQESAEMQREVKMEAEKAKKEKKPAKARKENEAAEKVKNDQEEAEIAEREVADKAKREKEAVEKANKENEDAENLRKEKEASEKDELDQEEAEKFVAQKAKKEAVIKAKEEQEAAEKAKIEQEVAENAIKEKKATVKAKEEKEEQEQTKNAEKETAEKAKKEQEETKKAEKEAAEKAEKEQEETRKAEIVTTAKAKGVKDAAEKAKKEREDAELAKKKEETERIAEEVTAKAKKDKEADKEAENIEKEAADKAKKEKEVAEKARKEQEEAATLKKQKEAAEKVRKDEEDVERVKNEEKEAEKNKKDKKAAAKAKKDKESAEKARKDQEEAEKVASEKAIKEKEVVEKAKIKQEEADKIRKEKDAEENAKKEQEDATKEQQEAKKAKKEKIKAVETNFEKVEAEKTTAEIAKKEKEAAENIKKMQEETEKVQREAADKHKKEKEVAGKARKDLEEAELLNKEKEAAEKDAVEKVRKDKEDVERAKKEEKEAEMAKKDKKVAAKAKKDKETAEKARKDQEEAKKIASEKAEKEAVEKAKIEQEEVDKIRKEKDIEEKAKKEQEAAQKEQEKAEKARKDKKAATKAKKDKEAAEKASKEQEEAKKIASEKAEKEAVEKAKIELEEADKIRKEKEAAEKASKEQEEAEKVAAEKAIKEKETAKKAKIEQEKADKERKEKEAFEKAKEEQEHVQKEQEKTEKARKEKEAAARAKKDKETAEKASKEQEELEKVAAKKAIKEKESSEKAKIEQTKREKEGEQKAKKEQEEAQKEQQEVEKARIEKKAALKLKKEKESTEKSKKEIKQETETAEIEVTDIVKKEKQVTEKVKKEHEEAKRVNEEKDAAEKMQKEMKTIKDKEKSLKVKKVENEGAKKAEFKNEKVETKAITMKAKRETDTEFFIKSDSISQNNTENGKNYRASEKKDARYIKEYQYEPTSVDRKFEVKEKPKFVDHSHRDYTMEFARPAGYRERSFDDRPSDPVLQNNLGRTATIYKAQTIVLDSQLRSSLAPPLLDLSRSSEPTERRRLESRVKSKALSEARSLTSDKRSSLSRDSKRKPVFSTYLTDRTAVEGSRVKLTCSVLSATDPTITWYKNGVPLDNKLKYRTKFVDGLITLEVLNAVPTDSAEYNCTVVNENGSVSSSANLKVYPSFEASPIPPTFTRSIRDTYHMAENELVLECRIRGQPLPTISWLKDDKPITSNERYQAYYLADGVCRLAIESPTPEDSGKYTCKAENSVWSDQITHVVNFTGKENRLSPNFATLERSRFNRQSLESRRPHFTNVLNDYKVVKGGTIGLQVEIRGAPTRVEWLREGTSVTELYRNAKTFVEQELYTLALSDVTENESGLYTCRAWSTHGNVDMNAAITVVQPNELDGKPPVILGRPEKDLLISVGEDINISFRVHGEPRPKVIFMKGIRDITNNQRVCKMTSDDYVKFTLKRSVVSDAGTYCILARNAYGCDRAFVTVEVRQRASSDNLISDWTYPLDDSTLSITERKYKSVPERIPGAPSVVEGGNNWVSLVWPKPDPGVSAPVLAYKVEGWLLGKEGGARWTELGITPLNSFDAFNLKQGAEYHFRVTPRNRYGWGEAAQTTSPVAVGVAGDRPEFFDILPGQLKILAGETANLSCTVKGNPAPEVVWMKNGHEIDEERKISTSFDGRRCSLTIKEVNIEDEARYSCEATNIHGRASTYARLAVVTDRLIWEADAKLKRERSSEAIGEYPPQFTMRLRDRRVQATYPVRLTCQVVGCPSPKVVWYKDGIPVESDNRHTTSQDEHFHTLEIAPTNLEDGGVYEALARNSCGAVSCRCCLVVDKGIRAYVAPEFCCGLDPLYRLCDGEELRISAVVEAYPSVGVTWYRDGIRLRPSRRTIMTLDRDGQIELALAAVTPRDAGVYTCTASNEVGRASTSGKVEVIGGADVRRPPPVVVSPDVPYSKEPMFIRKPRSSEAREGDTVIIQCEVIGDPKPDVYWLRDFLKPDYYRDATHFRRVGDGPEYRFEIPHAKLDYTGAYSVVARNVHGEAKAVISLQILVKDPNEDAPNVRYGAVEVLPRFERHLTDLLSCDGDAVEFECRISGHPEPNVRWFHYHELIRECPDFESTFDDGTARLKIKQVTAEDEGTYTCEAANCLGKATSSACLVVYPPGEPNTLSQRLRRPPALLSAASTPRSTPRTTPARSVSRTPGPDPRRLCSPQRQMAPSFYTYPFNKVAEEGDNITFQCAIKGLPAPWATWDKDGVILSPSSRITIKEKDEILRILEIEQVTTEDVGIYRITVENEFGRAEASARLEVITHKGKFYSGLRSISPSPRKSYSYRSRRTPSPSPRKD